MSQSSQSFSVVVSPPAGNVVPASILWQQSFENFGVQEFVKGTTYGTSAKDFFHFNSSGQTSPHSCVDTPTYEGNRALRLFVKGNNAGGDPSSFRADITISSWPKYRLPAPEWYFTTYWIGFAVFVPSNFPTNDGRSTVISQSHNISWNTTDAYGNPWTAVQPDISPQWCVRIIDGHWTVTREWINRDGTKGSNTRYLVSGSTTGLTAPSNASAITPDLGQWTRFVWRVVYHPWEGRIQLWKNDALLYDYDQVESYPDQIFGYYLNDVYSSQLQTASGQDRTLYFDSIRIADEALGGNYATVNPASYRP